MNNKHTHQAIHMIIQGHSVETVMNILSLEPEELMDILMALETGLGPELEPKKVHIVECVLETIESDILGEFDLNCN